MIRENFLKLLRQHQLKKKTAGGFFRVYLKKDCPLAQNVLSAIRNERDVAERCFRCENYVVLRNLTSRHPTLIKCLRAEIAVLREINEAHPYVSCGQSGDISATPRHPQFLWCPPSVINDLPRQFKNGPRLPLFRDYAHLCVLVSRP